MVGYKRERRKSWEGIEQEKKQSEKEQDLGKSSYNGSNILLAFGVELG